MLPRLSASRLLSCAVTFLCTSLLVAPSRAQGAASAGTATLVEVKVERPAPDFFYDATVASTYLFQGIDYGHGRSVVQPSATLSWLGVSANLWGNVQASSMAANEIDASLKYGQDVGRLSAAAGYLHIRYPNRALEPSQEFFVDVAVMAPLHPSLSVHYDFDRARGSYSTLGVRHDLSTNLSLASNLFYHSTYYGLSGIPAVELKLATSFPVGTTRLTQSASYFKTWENGDFRDAARVPSTWQAAINLAR